MSNFTVIALETGAFLFRTEARDADHAIELYRSLPNAYKGAVEAYESPVAPY